MARPTGFRGCAAAIGPHAPRIMIGVLLLAHAATDPRHHRWLRISFVEAGNNRSNNAPRRAQHLASHVRHQKSEMAGVNRRSGLDVPSLERELATAVDVEAHRYRVDEMKKRAITSASSYDEFKNLVACADLKPVTGREMRKDLFTTQRDFVPGSGLRAGSPALGGAAARTRRVGKRRKRADATGDAVSETDAKKTESKPAGSMPPRSILDLELAWGRTDRDEARTSLLDSVGASCVAQLFTADADANMASQVMDHVLTSMSYDTSARLAWLRAVVGSGSETAKKERWSIPRLLLPQTVKDKLWTFYVDDLRPLEDDSLRNQADELCRILFGNGFESP